MAPSQKAARIVQSSSGHSGIRATDTGKDLRENWWHAAKDLMQR